MNSTNVPIQIYLFIQSRTKLVLHETLFKLGKKIAFKEEYDICFALDENVNEELITCSDFFDLIFG